MKGILSVYKIKNLRGISNSIVKNMDRLQHTTNDTIGDTDSGSGGKLEKMSREKKGHFFLYCKPFPLLLVLFRSAYLFNHFPTFLCQGHRLAIKLRMPPNLIIGNR